MKLQAFVVSFTLPLLAGCASVNPEPAFTDVRKAVADRTGEELSWARTAEQEQQGAGDPGVGATDLA